MLTKEHKRQLYRLAAVLCVAVALLWPAYVNGEPFYMPDTTSYLRGADAAVHQWTGIASAWTEEFLRRFPAASTDVAATTASAAPGEIPVVLSGRSIYYGFLLYFSQWFGNFWLVAIVQALLVAVAVQLTVAAFGRAQAARTSPVSTLVIGLVLAALTPAGYFSSYLLPDVFGALGLLACLHLAFFGATSSTPVRLFWFALLLAATLFHAANFLLTGLLAVLAAVGLLLKLPASKQGLCTVAAALALSATGQAAFSWGVEHATGAAPVRPPFIAARIIDDGPGYEYLREHCPEAGLIYCRAAGFETRISDALLWSKDPSQSIFQALTPSEQRRASSEERQFVLAVLADRPLDLLRSSIGAFFRQMTFFDLKAFNYNADNISHFERKIPSPFIDHARNSLAFQDRMPVRFVEWTTIAAVLIALAVIVAKLRATIGEERRLREPAMFLLALLAGVLINAAICGCISTPKGRYQMRLIWVLPLAAMSSIPMRRSSPSKYGEGGLAVSS